jgi:hypothetical protein
LLNTLLLTISSKRHCVVGAAFPGNRWLILSFYHNLELQLPCARSPQRPVTLLVFIIPDLPIRDTTCLQSTQRLTSSCSRFFILSLKGRQKPKSLSGFSLLAYEEKGLWCFASEMKPGWPSCMVKVQRNGWLFLWACRRGNPLLKRTPGPGKVWNWGAPMKKFPQRERPWAPLQSDPHPHLNSHSPNVCYENLTAVLLKICYVTSRHYLCSKNSLGDPGGM